MGIQVDLYARTLDKLHTILFIYNMLIFFFFIFQARKPAGNGLGNRNKGATHFGYQPTSIKFDPQISNSNVPFGSR